MLQRSSIHLRAVQTRRLLVLFLVGCLAFLTITFLRRTGPAGNHETRSTQSQATGDGAKTAPRKLEGEGARAYLEKTDEGQSLMKALEVERFGLKWQKQSPFESSTNLSLSNTDGGYLGMSHDENLNAWFDDEGVTIRPTLSEKDRAKAWRLDMKLKAYGYGSEREAAPPIISRNVKDNRIEYARDTSNNPQSETRNPKLVEWYVNKSAGIEQGFTVNERPAHPAGVRSNEPLRLIVSVQGDLRARATHDGQSVELNRGSEPVLNYGHLVAVDADGRKLAGRMETNVAGDEIALVVDDADVQYPITIDPITATQKLKLTAPTPQTEARFGFAVALEYNLAVVGSWREDVGSTPDAGAVYVFSSGSFETNFAFEQRFGSLITTVSQQCGYSVAVSQDKIVYGCPGAESEWGYVSGRAFMFRRTGPNMYVGQTLESALASYPEDRYGTSVAISGSRVVVGAPGYDSPFSNSGMVHYFDLNVSSQGNGLPTSPALSANAEFGTSVAIDGNLIVAGAPGGGRIRPSGVVLPYLISGGPVLFPEQNALDDEVGDRFGNSIDIYGTTVVIGSPNDDNERGTDAGAAYVYDFRDPSAPRILQKLKASDGQPGDLFSEHAVAIDGNTIVVGAYSNGSPIGVDTDDDRGAAYIFTRKGDFWTQEAKISPSNFQGGEPAAQFGIAVDIRFDVVIIGARAASAGDTLRAGAAFVYRLDCVAPYEPTARVSDSPNGPTSTYTACPGTRVYLAALSTGATYSPSYQWRKNSVNIPGATNSLYIINNVSATDAGTYDVIITNACGSVISTPATLAVHTLNINPTAQNFGTAGSNGIVNVTSSGSCGWTATSNASWITITSGASGNGSGTVSFTVAANSGPQRTGTLTIAGQTFTVTQDGTIPTPTVFVEAGNTTQAVALDSVTFVRGPFRPRTSFNFSSDGFTRVILFTTSLGLTQADVSRVTVTAGGISLPVENVGTVQSVTGLSASYIIVRLVDGLPTGNLPLIVIVNGVQSSNSPTLGISP